MTLHGNNVYSEEYKIMADFLEERNLEHANHISKEVKPRSTFYTRFGKRLLDLCIVIPAIIVLFPVYFVLAIVTAIDLGRPIFYYQTRNGYKGKSFNIIKFRSMKNLLDKDGRQLPARQRLTKYGRFIRKVSLDELPQLLNILKGEMSIIGPRALPMFFAERMTERHKMMCAVRPGLECPSISANPTEARTYMTIFENNIWYVENISLLTDIKLLISLVRLVFAAKERSRHAESASYFVGYDDNGNAMNMKKAKELFENSLHEN